MWLNDRSVYVVFFIEIFFFLIKMYIFCARFLRKGIEFQFSMCLLCQIKTWMKWLLNSFLHQLFLYDNLRQKCTIHAMQLGEWHYNMCIYINEFFFLLAGACLVLQNKSSIGMHYCYKFTDGCPDTKYHSHELFKCKLCLNKITFI